MLKKLLWIGVGFLALSLILIFPTWRDLLNLVWIQHLKDNLDFIGAFISRYPWLATVATALILLAMLMRKFNLNSTTIKFFGVEFELKQTEDKIKTQVKNYLSTKRSIFVFYDDYDNYYDCINSMYQILQFLRKQLANFDSFSQTENETYKHIEGMIKEIGRFLTKYQSDYRRYYEMKIPPKKTKNDKQKEADGEEKTENPPEKFIPFKEVQDAYPKSESMLVDFHKLNNAMKPHAEFFNLDIKKWKNWYP